MHQALNQCPGQEDDLIYRTFARVASLALALAVTSAAMAGTFSVIATSASGAAVFGYFPTATCSAYVVPMKNYTLQTDIVNDHTFSSGKFGGNHTWGNQEQFQTTYSWTITYHPTYPGDHPNNVGATLEMRGHCRIEDWLNGIEGFPIGGGDPTSADSGTGHNSFYGGTAYGDGLETVKFPTSDKQYYFEETATAWDTVLSCNGTVGNFVLQPSGDYVAPLTYIDTVFHSVSTHMEGTAQFSLSTSLHYSKQFTVSSVGNTFFTPFL